MQTELLDYTEIPQLSATDVAYVKADSSLRKFYRYEVDYGAFKQIMSDKSKAQCDRGLLVEVLENQYSSLQSFEVVHRNIKELTSDNTFTVVTAHQPNLLLGPLYFVYKILSVIKLSQELNTKFPEKKIIPLFVIGGEDHDFEEVNHARLFNKQLDWHNNEKGAVGMMDTSSLAPVLVELQEILGDSENAKKIFSVVARNYRSYSEYHTATQSLLNDLFGNFGLVVLNMNDRQLKRRFIPFIAAEIFDQPSKKLVEETQNELQVLGFKPQAFPREINLFYLREQLRERIVFEDGVYKVLNTTYQFTKSEMEAEINAFPERFSPNVVLRPIYQEFILPNLAYIGGGGELAYWLERKSQFEYFGVNFPMLIRRKSILWIDEAGSQKMSKLQLATIDLFQDVETVVKRYVLTHSDVAIDLQKEKDLVREQFEKIVQLAIKVDTTLEKTVAAEQTKSLQGIEMLESRIIKAEKHRQETAVQQIRTLVQRYCPNGGLQERSENFLPFYIKYGPTFFDELLKVCDPLQSGFAVVRS